MNDLKSVTRSYHSVVANAHAIAEHAHAGQFRRDGVTPYINHVRDVAHRVELLPGVSPEMIAAAWLHDVLEDTTLHAGHLLDAGIPENVIGIVQLLTHARGQNYLSYIASITNFPDVGLIKVQDILSNLSDSPTTKQLRKYARALLILTYPD